MTPLTENSALSPFDAAQYLDSDKPLAAYLTEVLKEQDLDALIQALGTAVRARRMTADSEANRLAREALYEALQAEATPRWETVLKMFQALGLQLIAMPTSAAQP